MLWAVLDKAGWPLTATPREKATVVAQWTQTPQRDRLRVLLTRYQFLFKNMLKTWRSVSQGQEEGSAQIRHRKQKSALKPARAPPRLAMLPQWAACGHKPQAWPSRGLVRVARQGRGLDLASWRRSGGMGEQERKRPALKGRGAGEPQAPGSRSVLAGSLLLAPPPAVGRGRRGGDILSIHLDHSLATKARTDGHLVQVKPEHLHEGLGWVSNLSRVRGHDAGPRWRGERRGPPAGEQGSAPAGVPRGRAQPCWLTSLARWLQREAEWRQALP